MNENQKKSVFSLPKMVTDDPKGNFEVMLNLVYEKMGGATSVTVMMARMVCLLRISASKSFVRSLDVRHLQTRP